MGEGDGASFRVDGGLGVGLGALVVVGSSVEGVGGHGVCGKLLKLPTYRSLKIQ